MILLEFFDLYSSKDFIEGPFASQIVGFMPSPKMEIDIIVGGTSTLYIIDRVIWQIDCENRVHSIRLPVPIVNCYVREIYEPQKNRRLGDMPEII